MDERIKKSNQIAYALKILERIGHIIDQNLSSMNRESTRPVPILKQKTNRTTKDIPESSKIATLKIKIEICQKIWFCEYVIYFMLQRVA